MAKFYGAIGYGLNVETAPGVWDDTIVEKTLSGDILRNVRLNDKHEPINNDLSISNSVSVVADAFANENFHAIRYVKWAGVFWDVTNVEVQRPRLLLRLGGVYSGPKPS